MPSHQAFVWMTVGSQKLLCQSRSGGESLRLIGVKRMVATMANAVSMAKTTFASCSMQPLQHATTSCSIQCGSSHQADASHCAHGHCATRTVDTLVKRDNNYGRSPRPGRKYPEERLSDNKCDVCGHLRHARRAVIRVASAASVIVEHRAQSQQARFGDAIHVIKSWTTSTTSTCKSTCTMCIVLVVIQAQRSAAAPLTPFQCERCVVLRFVACM